MPRKARIDAPGALHHIIVKGIERRKIFLDDLDRDNFLKHLDNVLSETATLCFARALIPNHARLLLKTGTTASATVMRRRVTGYAVSFDRRHRRYGLLFQNRYKSILGQRAFERLIKRVANLFEIFPKELLSGGKHAYSQSSKR
jgi:REP element-mobilizing transposase RayT